MMLAASLSGGAQQINPITRAMLDGYEEILKENPNDYQTLYERAAQLYRLSQYDRAMNDLSKALQLTPVKESDMRLRELTLMTDVAIEMKNYELALKSVEEALAIDPDNYANIYKKGNVDLLLNRPEDAYRAYSSMQRLKTRSQEAYFGMAKADIMLNKMAEAEELLKEAEAADPSNFVTYCRIGDLYQDMNQPEKASSNYLIAFSMASDPTRPLNSLVNLAKTNYPAVAAALNYALEKSTNRVPLLYLKGSIALEAGYYADAADAFGKLVELPDGHDDGIYSQLAQADLYMGDTTAAMSNINKALNLSGKSSLYVVKSRIELAEGNINAAVMDASKGVAANTSSVYALIAKARALIAEKNGEEALKSLNEAVMLNPENAEALLLRAYVNTNMLNNGKVAISDLNRIATAEFDTMRDIAMQCIARAKIGKTMDAESEMTEALKTHNTPSDLYYAAVYYAQTDNLQKGIELLKRAIYEGFQNKYLVELDDEPWFNVAALRHLL